MGKFCTSCGKAIPENSNFCTSCGAKVSSYEPENNDVPAKADKLVTNRVKSRAVTFASSSVSNITPALQSAGEAVLPAGNISDMGDMKFFPSFLSGVRSFFGGFKNIFKNKKRLTAVIILAVIWFALILLQSLGINPFPVKLAAWLTFAQGGASNNIIRMAGGVLGKGIFATCFVWLLAGGYKNIGSGLKGLGRAYKQFSLKKLARLLMGTGAALIIYNFMAGYASVIKSMVGVASFLLVLRSLGSNGGFLRRLAASLTAGKNSENKTAPDALLQGLAIGFALSVPLSLIPWGYTQYCSGLAILIAGIILLIVSNSIKRRTVARMALMLFAALIILPAINASAKGTDDEWAGYWTYNKSVVIGYSNELASYYSSQQHAYAKISYTADKNKVDFRFNYTGEGYNTDLYEEALKDPEKFEYTDIILPGEHAYFNVTLSSPAQQYRENEKISIPFSAGIYDEKSFYFNNVAFSVLAWNYMIDVSKASKLDYNSEIKATDTKFGDRFVIPDDDSNDLLLYVDFSPADNYKIENRPMICTTPYGLNNGDIMVIDIQIRLNSSPISKFFFLGEDFEQKWDTVRIYHFYTWKYGAQNLITNTNAADFPGEDEGVSIPAIIINGILGAGAGLAGSGGSDGGDDKKKKYKMCLRKDFGDTIPVGERVAVFARIVEITPEGEERSRSDLSAMISISSPEYLVISNTGVAGEYMAAYVEAPNNGEIPETAVVSFIFSGEGGNFTNNVMFKIVERKIVFGQDNLTLPAGYDRTERLPFAVIGMVGDISVTASVSREEGYSVEIEPGEEAGLYYALITEKIKTKGEAGDYDPYTLTVKAQSGEQTVTKDLSIYRFHMGLRLDIDSIGCYAEEYDPMKHQSKKFLFTVGGKPYVPAEAKGKITLFNWDDESHKIQRIAPAALDYKIQAIQEADQSMMEKLAIQCQMTEDVSDGSSLIFRCCKGALDAPTRFTAKVSITYKRSEEEIYTVEKEVLLRSQPQRQFNGMEDSMTALKADERIRDWLNSVKSNIWNMDFLHRLFPLVKFIDVMLDGYHDAYGFDAGQVETVKQIWGNFLDGSFAGANAQAQKVTLGDEMRLFIDSLMQTEESVEKSLGFWSRLAVGVATLGCSEVVFTAFETAREMKEYVDKGGDSAFDGFVVGAWVVTKEFLLDYGMSEAMGALKNTVPPAQAKQALREMKDNMKESTKRFLTSVTGRQTKAAASNAVNATKQAANQAKQVLNAGKKGLRDAAEHIELDEAFDAGKKFAKEQVENLQAAAWQYELNPTKANRKLLDDLVLKVQQDKLAMYELCKKPDIDATRKVFNETLEGFNSNADIIAKNKLSSVTGIPTDQIKIMNAGSSSKKALKSGRKITYDRDWTAYYTNSKGEVVYFDQNLTEQIYYDSFYESTQGFKNKSAEMSRRFGLSNDQTVIEDVLGHSESYGSKGNLEKMMNRAQQHIALDDPVKAKNAVTYKIKDRLNHAKEMMAEARAIPDEASRQLALGKAAGEIIEGGRMATKQFDNIINLRDIARSTGDGASKISGKLRSAVEMIKFHFDNLESFCLSDLERGLGSLGYTLESLADELGDTLLRIG